MSQRKVTCKVCGYTSIQVFQQGKGYVHDSPLEMKALCKNFGSGSLGHGCENFDKALSEPHRSR